MSLQLIFLIIAILFFLVFALFVGLAIRYFIKQDIRAVNADLSGRTRQEGIERTRLQSASKHKDREKDSGESGESSEERQFGSLYYENAEFISSDEGQEENTITSSPNIDYNVHEGLVTNKDDETTELRGEETTIDFRIVKSLVVTATNDGLVL